MVIVVPCGREKRLRPCRARDLYTGRGFHHHRITAEAIGLPWVIISAEYGFVDPDEVIAPYDRRLQSQGDVDHLIQQLCLRPLPEPSVISWANQHYNAAMREAGLSVHEPLKHIGSPLRNAYLARLREQAREERGLLSPSLFV